MTKINFNHVTNKLKAAGKIKSEADMGNLLGKGQSYVSSRKSKKRPPSLDALTHLAFNLEQDIQEFEEETKQGMVTEDDWESASILWELQNEVFAVIRETVQRDRPEIFDRHPELKRMTSWIKD
jgi:transcriptional regulator with XRE-family HTH domain